MLPRKLFISLCGESERLERCPVRKRSRTNRSFVEKPRVRTKFRDCSTRSGDRSLGRSGRATSSKSAVHQEGICSLVLVRSFISIERNVISSVRYFSRRCPIKCGIEEKSAQFRFPFQPRVSKRITGATFSDHEAHIRYAI